MRVLVVMVAVALAGCAGAGGARWFDASDLKSDTGVKDADVVYLREHVRFTMNLRGGRFSTSEEDRHLAFQVLTEEGLEQANFRIEHDEKDEIQELRGRSIAPDGTVRELAPGDVFDEVASKEHGEATQRRVRIWRVPGVKVGSIVEVGYRLVVPHTWGSVSIGPTGTAPVKLWEGELLVNDRIRYAVRPYNSNVPIKRDRDGDMTRFSWTLRDIPGRESDDYTPDSSMERPLLVLRVKQVVFGRYVDDWIKDWPGAFMDEAKKFIVEKDLFDADPPALGCRDDVRCKIDAAVAELRKTPMTSGRWWVDDVRAVSKIRGSGMITPLDKFVLMIHTLRGAGLEVKPAFYVAPFTRMEDLEFPRHGAYDGLALYVPAQKGLAKAVWIDPACEYCSAGQLSAFLEGSMPWVVSAQPRFEKDPEVSVERIKAEGDPAVPSREVTTTDLRVEASGNLAASRSSEERGRPATMERLKRRGWTRTDFEKNGHEWVTSVAATGVLRDPPAESADAQAGSYRIAYSYDAPSYATAYADKIVVPLTAMKDEYDDLFPTASRRSAVIFETSEEIQSVARVHVPTGYRLSEVPHNDEKQTPGLTASFDARLDGDVVVVTRTLRMTRGAYALDAYPALYAVAQTYRHGKSLALTFVKAP